MGLAVVAKVVEHKQIEQNGQYTLTPYVAAPSVPPNRSTASLQPSASTTYALFTNITGPLFRTLPTSGLQAALFIISDEWATQGQVRSRSETGHHAPRCRDFLSADRDNRVYAAGPTQATKISNRQVRLGAAIIIPTVSQSRPWK